MNFAQAGVPFIHCLESPKCMHHIFALAGFPQKQLCQVSAGSGGELGDALGAGTPAWGRAAVPMNGSCLVAVPARGVSSTASSVEREEPTPGLSLQQKNGDEAVKTQVILHFAQLAGDWGGTAGSQACRKLSKTVSGLCASHQLCPWPLSWEATCQPAWELWGRRFLAGPHLHNLWC